WINAAYALSDQQQCGIPSAPTLTASASTIEMAMIAAKTNLRIQTHLLCGTVCDRPWETPNSRTPSRSVHLLRGGADRPAENAAGDAKSEGQELEPGQDRYPEAERKT